MLAVVVLSQEQCPLVPPLPVLAPLLGHSSSREEQVSDRKYIILYYIKLNYALHSTHSILYDMILYADADKTTIITNI